MKNTLVTLSPRAALFIGAALLSTPSWAQDTTVTPPPVVSTVPAPAPAPAPTIVIAPSSPVVQAVPEPSAEAPARAAPRAAARRPATSTTATTRQVTRTTAPAPAPVAAAPAPEAPAPAPVTAPAPEAAAPSIETQTTDIATTETTAPAQSPAPIWPWLLIGALIVAGAIAALLLRRRREDELVYVEPYEPVTVAPVVPVAVSEPAPKAARVAKPRPEPEVARPAIAAAAAAPLLGDTIENEPDLDYVEPSAEAELHEAEKDDLAGLTSNAPVTKRPWLEFGMRPVRAGTSSDEALVEIELTVGNAGDIAAKDVRISTFLMADGDASDMEQMLIERANDNSVPPVTIKPGEGTRVDATLAVRKDTLSEHEFSPMVVADARYTMADGTEGRTSATFRVGLWTDEAKLEPILFDRPEMHRDVAAELVGKPEHA